MSGSTTLGIEATARTWGLQSPLERVADVPSAKALHQPVLSSPLMTLMACIGTMNSAISSRVNEFF